MTDRTWLITGGATGIGFALAKAVAAQGNQVIICGRDSVNLSKASDEIPGLITRRCDVADSKSRHALVAWVSETHPDLSVLVNNAGIQIPRDFAAGDAVRDLDAEIATNFAAPIHLIEELLPLLRQQPEATIVNVTSGLAYAPLALFPVYCATKAALHSFTMTLRYQLGNSQVEVVEMAPPMVVSELRSNVSAQSNPALREALTPEEFVAAALPQLENGDVEVLVGQSVNSRQLGEALFSRMNP